MMRLRYFGHVDQRPPPLAAGPADTRGRMKGGAFWPRRTIDESESPKPLCPVYRHGVGNELSARRARVLEAVLQSEPLPFVSPHLVERQHLDALDVAEAAANAAICAMSSGSSVSPGTST